YGSKWSPEEGTTDSRRSNGNIRINYGFSPITVFSWAYNYSDTRYKEREPISRQSVSIGIRQYITQLFYINGRIGMDYSSSSTNNTKVEASLTGPIDEKTALNIAYLKGDEISSDREDLFRNWRVTGSLTRELSEDLISSLSGFYGEGKFVDLDVIDSLLGVSLNITYDFWEDKKGKSIRGNVGYTYSDLSSTDENRSYSRSGVTLGLTVGF
ncbi:MAG: hypothetical protein AB1499_10230, partial [Nitrospirota bacterium]